MSRTHDIDNDDPLFQFDSFDDPIAISIFHHFSQSHSSTPSTRPSSLASTRPPSPYGDQPISPTTDKGKSVSQPVPIRTSTSTDAHHDLFDLSPSNSGSSTGADPHLYSSYFDLHSPLDDILRSLGHDQLDSRDPTQPLPNKGKGKELPPTLPPFSPAEFGYGNIPWPSPSWMPSTPGPSSFELTYGSIPWPSPVSIPLPSAPSSYGSGYGSLTKTDLDPPSDQPPNLTDDETSPLNAKKSPPTLRRMPSRRRSFSTLSIHSTHSVPRIKLGSPKVSDSLARKLLFRRRRDPTDSRLDDDQTNGAATHPQDIHTELSDVGQGNCLLPWRADLKSRRGAAASSAIPFSTYLGLNVDHPYFRTGHGGLKVKGRSYSSPLPYSSIDIATPVCADILAPIPLLARNYFDEIPRELRLEIMSSLLALHEAEYERYKMEGKWTVLKASSLKGKWVGRDRGIRELVKLSRVSKPWHTLVFDGQLWTNLDLHSFPKIPPSLLLRLAGTAGTFIRALNLMGHSNLLATTLSDVTTSLCLEPAPLGNLSCTQLTSINLQGCSALTTRSLHHLLIRSPSLQTLSLKGLNAVTNTTCDVLAAYCPQLISLNLSRCPSMDGYGLLSLTSAVISRGERLLLKELRLSGLKQINDKIMATLGRAAPYLEVLDLSYARQLHNSALEAFVSFDDDEAFGEETIFLTSREAGRDPGDPRKYRRRVTRLRHLCLSSCVLLTDIACSNLAYTVPHLELLEMAGIGAELRDDGLVRLLNTTTFIRRLDLEDANEITDAVIAAITPDPLSDLGLGLEDLRPGHALEHLAVSFATSITDHALLSLVRGCPRLRVLEVDNTHVSGSVLKEFVRTARERQIADAQIVAIDCRGISEPLVKELSTSIRPRLGWRSHHGRKLKYLDGRDKEDLKIGQDECDETRVVLKTFYSWQTVDAVKAARKKRRKTTSRRAANDSNGSVTDSEEYLVTTNRGRWWSPGSGRRVSGGSSPTPFDTNSSEGCRVM